MIIISLIAFIAIVFIYFVAWKENIIGGIISGGLILILIIFLATYEPTKKVPMRICKNMLENQYVKVKIDPSCSCYKDSDDIGNYDHLFNIHRGYQLKCDGAEIFYFTSTTIKKN